MPTPVSYLSGNTLSYQSGMVKKGTVGLNLTSSLTGNYRWWNGVEVTSSQYLIYSDTYSTGASNEANVTPAAWSTPDLTDQSLLNLINTLPDRIGQTAFTTLSNALIWLNQSGKYFLVKNGYENLVTSGLTLNLDAGWTNSYSGTTSWRDISGNGKTGTLTNGPAFNSGNTGSIYFDGTDDFCVVPSSSLNGLSSGSISVWVKFLNLNFQYVLSLPNSSGNNGFDILIENGKLDSYLLATNSAGSTGSQFVPKLDIWYNVVTTYDGTTHKLFVNGILISSVGRSGTIQNGIGQTFLGRFSSGFGAYSNNYTSNAQLYNRALSQTEILQNYQLYKNRFGYDVVENGLVLNLNSQNYVSYRETGTSWYDLTGNNNTGTLTNGPTFDSTTRSVVFDGSDDYVITTGFTSYNGSQGTLCALVYPNAGNNNTYVIAVGEQGITGKSRAIGTIGGKWWLVGYGSGNEDWITNFDRLENRWSYVTYTWSATTNISASVNGAFDSVVRTGLQIPSGSEARIGAPAWTNLGAYGRWNGKISNSQIYNRALTQSEILQNYYQGNIVTNGLIMNLDAGNLVSYGGTGTIWSDLTNTTTGGTLTNGPTYSTLNGGSIVFDGIDDTVSFPAITLGSTFTISQTLVASGTYNYGYMPIGGGSINGGSTYRGYVWFNTNSSFITTEIIFSQDGEVGGFNFTLPASIPRYTLFQYTLVKNGSTAYFYINGNLITTQSVSAGTNFTVRNLGWSYSSYYMNRDLYNTLIYNRALTQSEVIQNFNAHKSRYGL
jgi:hypothetical protein